MENTFCDHKLESGNEGEELKNIVENDTDVHNPVHIRIQELDNAIYYEIELTEDGEVFKTSLSAIQNPELRHEDTSTKVAVRRSVNSEKSVLDRDVELSALEVLDESLGILTKLLNLLGELRKVLEKNEDAKNNTKEWKTSLISKKEMIQKVPKETKKRILYLYPISSHKNKSNAFEDISVDFYHRTGYKIYDMKAKKGDFITGEVGKIDTVTGETSQVSDDDMEAIDSLVTGCEIHDN